MPEICRFLGIIISMYFTEHNPPHFHVRYNEHRAVISIRELNLLDGQLPARVRGTEINNSPILLVFQLVFCVASKDTYFNMLPLMRLEYELKSCAIFVELFSSVPLRGLVSEWAELNKDELLSMWESKKFHKINPLV